ncbi:MAG: hypothetical protein JKY65_12380 [Planctomycetes bacterium]|nr:hypothetical protein [Planctomycetota bacterium]
MQYYVGVDDDRHMVDHPPLFACEWEGRKTLLTLNASFVDALLATAEDIMPGNPGEIAGIYFKPVEATFTLHSFLIPPKIVLYNPDSIRGPEALPYLVVLIDKKFFGIPAVYLTPDRFEGCDGLKHMKVKPRQARRPPGSSMAQSGKRRAAQPTQDRPKRRPQGQGPQGQGKGPQGQGKGPPKGPPRQGGRPPQQGRPDPDRRPPGKQRPRRPNESGSRGEAAGRRPPPR